MKIGFPTWGVKLSASLCAGAWIGRAGGWGGGGGMLSLDLLSFPSISCICASSLRKVDAAGAMLLGTASLANMGNSSSAQSGWPPGTAERTSQALPARVVMRERAWRSLPPG